MPALRRAGAEGQARRAVAGCRGGRGVVFTANIEFPEWGAVPGDEKLAGTVFDVSQTDGPPLPSLGVDELSGGVGRFDDLVETVRRACPYPVSFEPIDDGSKGFFSRAEPKRVAVKEGMSQAQTLKTLLHETAHALLHDSVPGEAGAGLDRAARHFPGARRADPGGRAAAGRSRPPRGRRARRRRPRPPPDRRPRGARPPAPMGRGTV